MRVNGVGRVHPNHPLQRANPVRPNTTVAPSPTTISSSVATSNVVNNININITMVMQQVAQMQQLLMYRERPWWGYTMNTPRGYAYVTPVHNVDFYA